MKNVALGLTAASIIGAAGFVASVAHRIERDAADTAGGQMAAPQSQTRQVSLTRVSSGFEPVVLTEDRYIEGFVTVESLVVPAGVTLYVTADTTLNAVGPIEIEGAIVCVDPDPGTGADASFLIVHSEDRIVIDGFIRAGNGADNHAIDGKGGNGGDLTVSAPRVTLGPDAPELHAGAGGNGGVGGDGGHGGMILVEGAISCLGEQRRVVAGEAGLAGDGDAALGAGHGGNGGNGGDAIIQLYFHDDQQADASPREQLGFHESATHLIALFGPGSPGQDGADITEGNGEPGDNSSVCTDVTGSGFRPPTAVATDGTPGGNGSIGGPGHLNGYNGGDGGRGGSATGGDGGIAGAYVGLPPDCCPTAGLRGANGGPGGLATAGLAGAGGNGGTAAAGGTLGGNGGSGGAGGSAVGGDGATGGAGGPGVTPGVGGFGGAAGTSTAAAGGVGGAPGLPGGMPGTAGPAGTAAGGTPGQDGVPGPYCTPGGGVGEGE